MAQLSGPTKHFHIYSAPAQIHGPPLWAHINIGLAPKLSTKRIRQWASPAGPLGVHLRR
uniref:Uncharacterized protein n=1 Tax=Oryza brachyantha TaxID=4533 RepID=J3N3G7_ORYBR